MNFEVLQLWNISVLVSAQKKNDVWIRIAPMTHNVTPYVPTSNLFVLGSAHEYRATFKTGFGTDELFKEFF